MKSLRMVQSPYNSRVNFFIILDMAHYITWFSDVVYIFVVNARVDGNDTVEKFRYDEKRRQLCHIRTYSDPTITQAVFLKIHVVSRYYPTPCNLSGIT